MDTTVSVSKGVFLFNNGFKKTKVKKKSNSNLFELLFTRQPWYITYKNNWEEIENQIKHLQDQSYSILLDDIVNYIGKYYDENYFHSLEGVIPSVTLLTGVNQPDHVNQFNALVNKIRDNVTPYVALINSQDASTLKHLVENAVWQLIHSNMDDIAEDSFDSDVMNTKVKKNLCTMKTLRNWYKSVNHQSPRKSRTLNSFNLRPLVIIMPDFESFNCNILQDFVMILSSYVSALPLVLVFGVATSVSALHKSFPYNVSSKLLIKVFNSQPSHVNMNEVLENIFLTHTSPFHLSGATCELLTDVFLFYDLSVTGLVQSIKYCMMDHYYGDNLKSLCCRRHELDVAVMNLSKHELEEMRRLMSFRAYVEAQDCRTRIRLLQDDDYLREAVYGELHKMHDYLLTFYLCVRLLAAFVTDLPKNILGKTIREVYTRCAADDVTNTAAFDACMQLIEFQSQVKLVETLKNALKVVNAAARPLRSAPGESNVGGAPETELGREFVTTLRVQLVTFVRQLEGASSGAAARPTVDGADVENVLESRYKLKEKLLKATRVDRIQSEFEMVRARFVSYLREVFSRGLRPPHSRPFHEIFFFTDVFNIKKQIVGSPRGALHTALSNPVHYLRCSCCSLPSAGSLSAALPDVCVAYKLHRECGKHVNLYDWLRAFAAVLRPAGDDDDDDDDDKRHEDPAVQVHHEYTS